jgi:DNA-directed RNA polymerase subunit RPC12/RpoP
MNYACTHCGELVSQDRTLEGPNYCIRCGKTFMVAAASEVPTWIWGVVVLLMANWQILRTANI